MQFNQNSIQLFQNRFPPFSTHHQKWENLSIFIPTPSSTIISVPHLKIEGYYFIWSFGNSNSSFSKKKRINFHEIKWKNSTFYCFVSFSIKFYVEPCLIFLNKFFLANLHIFRLCIISCIKKLWIYYVKVGQDLQKPNIWCCDMIDDFTFFYSEICIFIKELKYRKIFRWKMSL